MSIRVFPFSGNDEQIYRKLMELQSQEEIFENLVVTETPSYIYEPTDVRLFVEKTFTIVNKGAETVYVTVELGNDLNNMVQHGDERVYDPASKNAILINVYFKYIKLIARCDITKSSVVDVNVIMKGK